MRQKIEIGANKTNFSEIPNNHQKTIEETFYKGKAIPLQAWTGPDGSRRLRFPDFKTIGT